MSRIATSLLTLAVAGFFLCLATRTTTAATAPHYLITNNDFSQGNSATFYAISGGTLTQAAIVNTGGTGNDGIGSVATKRVTIIHNQSQSCVFLAEAGSVDVAGISITTLTATGTFKASNTDFNNLGMGVVNNGKYVYASFTGSGTIATYQILPGCKLQFLADTSAVGLAGAGVLDMQAHGNILVASFQDGSIESFNLAAGIAVSNGDLQYSTGRNQNDDPGGVDIDSTGHYAAFGGSASPAAIQVSDISSGKLTPTVVYSNLSQNSGSDAIWFSPDDSLLYFNGFNSGVLSAANFNQSTGALTAGCDSPTLKGGLDQAGLATAIPSGSGGVVYVAEPEASVGIVRVTVNGSTCQLVESSRSPVHDGNTITLESIGVFPPRKF